jgi:hypothetical protein
MAPRFSRTMQPFLNRELEPPFFLEIVACLVSFYVEVIPYTTYVVIFMRTQDREGS